MKNSLVVRSLAPSRLIGPGGQEEDSASGAKASFSARLAAGVKTRPSGRGFFGMASRPIPSRPARTFRGSGLLITFCLCLAICLPAFARPNSSLLKQAQKGTPMTAHATGTFDVKITPQPVENAADDASLGRYLVEKTFKGGLEG